MKHYIHQELRIHRRNDKGLEKVSKLMEIMELGRGKLASDLRTDLSLGFAN